MIKTYTVETEASYSLYNVIYNKKEKNILNGQYGGLQTSLAFFLGCDGAATYRTRDLVITW